LVSDGHALSRLDICKAALPNKVYNGSSIPNFTGGTNSEANTEDGHLIDGKRYNVEKITSRLQWTANFSNLSSFMEIDYANEMNVPLLSTKPTRAIE